MHGNSNIKNLYILFAVWVHRLYSMTLLTGLCSHCSVCIPGISEVIINHVLIQNGSELKKIVPAVQHKFYLFPEFQNGESVTQLAKADGVDYRPNISNN